MCCTDQKCSRFIQDRLSSKGLSKSEKQGFLDNLLLLNQESIDFKALILDSFGNYII